MELRRQGQQLLRPLLLAGKLANWGVVGAIHPGKLVNITDSDSGTSFLVDTGSSYSIIPHTSQQPPTGPLLRTANGQRVSCWGERRLTVVFGGHRYTWAFLLADVQFHIIGVDFLQHFQLLVDVAANGLRPALHTAAVTAAVPALQSSPSLPTVEAISSPSHHTVEALELGPPAAQQDLSKPPAAKQGPSSSASHRLSPKEAALLTEFADVLNAEGRLPPSTHGVEHHIITDGRPVTAKFRRLDNVKLAAAKEEFHRLEKEGIIRRSNSDWASPLHMVQKTDGSWRPCGDYRRLNLLTEPDCYPLPNMADITSSLAGATVFSKLDLKKGYHQIPVHPSHIKKTAIITPFGLFEFVRMPFGLKNAGMSFQRFIDKVLAGLPFVLVYLDDILVASPDRLSHAVHLRRVLERLRDNGLVLNRAKCEFFRSEVEFLGLKVTAGGVAPLPDQLAAVRDFPQPNTVKELQAFLGAVNFYRRFIPAAAKILLPLTCILKGGKKGSEVLELLPPMVQAFTAIKTALMQSVCLAFPVDTAELSLATDASATHVGAVLQQKASPGEDWRPLGFFSAKLETAQLAYSAFDRELFGIFAGIRHFRHHLEGRNFTVWTDHKPLTFALSRVSDSWTARQQRQLSYVAEFTNKIIHVPGRLNIVADLMSRPPQAVPAHGSTLAASVKVPSGSLAASQVAGRTAGAHPPLVAAASAEGVDLLELAKAQHSCTSVGQLRNSSSLLLADFPIGHISICCDTSGGRRRPLVPLSWQRKVFTAIHSLAHPGIRATRRLLAARFVWKGMAADVGRWCRECTACQRAKITTQPTAPVQPIHVPSHRFTHVHVDLVGPLPVSSGGHSHVMTIIDRSTRWVEVIPLSSTTATACADAFVAGWIARFGVPASITTDRGVQFTSAVWAVLCQRLGVQHITTTAYHPQSNGIVERFHRQLKDSLRARLASADWPSHLPWVLLGLRSAPKEDHNVSSAELLYGVPIALPGELVDTAEPPATIFLENLRRPPPVGLPTRPLPSSSPSTGPLQRLMEADFVFIRRGAPGPPLSPLYDGPYRVVAKSPKVFQLQLGSRVESVSVDRLKPCLSSETIPAVPPRRGRPPLHSSESLPSASILGGPL